MELLANPTWIAIMGCVLLMTDKIIVLTIRHFVKILSLLDKGWSAMLWPARPMKTAFQDIAIQLQCYVQI